MEELSQSLAGLCMAEGEHSGTWPPPSSRDHPQLVAEAFLWALSHWSQAASNPESYEALEESFNHVKNFLDAHCYDDSDLQDPYREASPGQQSLLKLTRPCQGGWLTREMDVSKSRASEASLPRRLKQQKPSDLADFPTEIWDNVFQHLSPQDLRNVRLSSKLLEWSSSSYFFKATVAPFSPRFYSAQSPETFARRALQPNIAPSPSVSSTPMFRSFAHHMRKFAISFDFDEESLALPHKLITNHLMAPEAVWFQAAKIQWPVSEHPRYDFIRDQELLAEDVSKMTEALGELINMREFALSLRSGYSWQHGGDCWNPAKVAKAVPGIFSTWPNSRQPSEPPMCPVVDSLPSIHKHLYWFSANFASNMFKQYARLLCRVRADPSCLTVLYQYISTHPLGATNFSENDFKQEADLVLLACKMSVPRNTRSNGTATLAHQPLEMIHAMICVSEDALNHLTDFDLRNFWRRTEFLQRSLIIQTREAKIRIKINLANKISGAVMRRDVATNLAAWSRHPAYRINKLSNDQARMIKEYENAQRALLASVLQSVLANKPVFSCIVKLHLVNISGCFISCLNRNDVWDTTSALSDVTLLVSPDWRTVELRNPLGLLGYTDKPVNPSDTSKALSKLVEEQLLRIHVKKLKLGFLDGGEHGVGVWARNQNLVPAPVFAQSSLGGEVPLDLSGVEELTLVNCWLTAKSLVELVEERSPDLLNLVLDSVSLVAFGGRTMDLDRIAVLPRKYLSMRGPQHGKYYGFGVPHQNAAYRSLFCMQADQINREIYTSPLSMQQALDSHYAFKEDSWYEVLSKIAPMTTRRQSFNERNREERSVQLKLHRLELKSCGYVELKHQSLLRHFSGVLPGRARMLNRPLRHLSLQPKLVLRTNDIFCGTIVASRFGPEQYILAGLWLISHGWGNSTLANANRDDGQPLGGTGRYSGVVVCDLNQGDDNE